jgi:hypothetical protein
MLHLQRVFGEVPNHVLVNFLLQINSHASINTDDFVGTNAGARGHIAAGVVDGNMVWKVTDHVVGALNGGSDELSGESLPGDSSGCVEAGLRSADRQQEKRAEQRAAKSSHAVILPLLQALRIQC